MKPSAEELSRFAGGRARLWDFSASHDRLVVRLTARDNTEVFLVLSGCEEVMAPVTWQVSSLRWENAPTPFVDLCDEGVRIRCQDASLHSSYARE